MRKRGAIRGQSRIIVIIVALTLNGLAVRADPPAARPAFEAGLEAFAASNFSAAAESFVEAAAAAPAEKLDPAAARYNAGLAAFAAGDLEAAAVHFNAAAAASDLGLQARAYYNRGNALFHLADSPLQAQALPGGDPAPALDTSESAIGQAIQMYENAIALDPDDADAKANYELAVLKQQIQQQQQDQQQDQEKKEEEEKEEGDSQPQPESGDSGEEQKEEEPRPQPDSQPSAGESQEESESPQPEASAEDMTPEEAEMLLDALKAQEQSQRDRLHPFLGRPVPVEKDW